MTDPAIIAVSGAVSAILASGITAYLRRPSTADRRAASDAITVKSKAEIVEAITGFNAQLIARIEALEEQRRKCEADLSETRQDLYVMQVKVDHLEEEVRELKAA